MELDSLLGSQRWKILEMLALEPSSPIEISFKLKTSVAYVSQQLKLLEAASIIHKERTGQSEKGKPRNIYHVSKEFLHLTLLANGNPKRKTLLINEHQKAIVNIWMMPDDKLHYILEKIFWSIEEELNEINGIFLDINKPKKCLYVISDSKKINSKLSVFSKIYSSIVEINLEGIASKKDFSNLYVIYDPLYLTRGKKMKGGDS